MASQISTAASQYLASLSVPTNIHPDHADCPICLESMGKMERAVIAHADHIIGENCLRQWVNQGRRDCPYCRQELFELTHLAPPAPQTFLQLLHTSSGPQTTQRIRLAEDDNMRNLASELTYEQYLAAISERDQAFVRQHILRLRSRVRQYRSDGLQYEESSIHQLRNMALASLPQDDMAHKVSAAYTSSLLFFGWQQRFSNTDGHRGYDFIHHPLASALLFETMDVLKTFNGALQTVEMMRWFISTRLGGLRNRITVPGALQGHWDACREWLVESACHFHVLINSGRKNIDESEVTLDDMGELHKALWE